jgi:hypothetical protein
MTQVQREKFTVVLKDLNLPAETQTILLQQADVYPALADGYLRQAEASRLMAEAQKKQADADKLHKDNEQWFNEKRPLFEQAQNRVKELEAQVAPASTAVGGENVDQAAVTRLIEERVAKIANPTPEQISTIVSQEVKKASDQAQTDFINNTLPALFNTTYAFSTVLDMHREFTGKRLTQDDRAALAEHMKANGINDPIKGWESWKAPDLQAQAVKAQVDDQVKAELAKRATTAVPGTEAYPQGAQPLGPVQQVRAGTAPVIPNNEGARLGDFAVASAAGAELIAEGKF